MMERSKWLILIKIIKLSNKIKNKNTVRQLEDQFLFKKGKKPNEKIEIKFNKSKKK